MREEAIDARPMIQIGTTEPTIHDEMLTVSCAACGVGLSVIVRMAPSTAPFVPHLPLRAEIDRFR